MHTRLIFGEGRLAVLPELMGSFGCSAAVLVTDDGLVDSEPVARTLELAGGSGRTVRTVRVPLGEPTVESVEAAASALLSGPCDVVIGVGGGSVMDTAKLARLISRQLDGTAGLGHARRDLKTRPASRLILIPTTAGTGSEVGPFAVVGDTEAGEKIAIGGDALAGDIALVDPEMTWSLPSAVTAATGFDALTHGVEAFCSKGASPITDPLALRSVRLASEQLGPTSRQPQPDGRAAMMEAASLAGISFANAGLGLCHAMSGPLGATTHLAHGVANAMLLTATVEYNRLSLGSRYGELASAMAGDPVERLAEIVAELGFPTKLSEVGVSGSDIPTLASAAMQSRQVVNNPRPATADDMESILRALL
ncbi:MAG: iron-containing alcohol dehydrogenase family protein [Acidimicrobiales bacterium]